jgi:hypothetical protein
MKNNHRTREASSKQQEARSPKKHKSRRESSLSGGNSTPIVAFDELREVKRESASSEKQMLFSFETGIENGNAPGDLWELKRSRA